MWNGRRMAQLGASEQDAGKAIPFPSVIRPMIHLPPAGTWAERAMPAP
jgi:hypothetical protein